MIRIIGAINEEAFKKFSKRLADIEDGYTKDFIVEIELTSNGGSAYDALAFAGRIRNSHNKTVIRAYGLVASAAVLVLAAGHVREMASEAWVMVHEDSGTLKGDVISLERESAHMRRLETQWATELAKYCNGKSTAEQWTEMHKKTTYLSATECLEMGLVDKII